LNKGGYKEGEYAGAIAYLVTLIENARSGAWRERMREYERPAP